MNLVRLLCVLSVFFAASVRAQQAGVLVVFGKNVSANAQQVITSAVAAEAEVVDAGEYEHQAREKALLPHSDAALERVAPRVQARLIVVAQRAGAKLLLTYRDGGTGEVLRKDSVPERRAAGPRLQSRVAGSVRRLLGSLAATSRSAPSVDSLPLQDEPHSDAETQADAEPPAGAEEQAATNESSQAELEPEPESPPSDRFAFELSAGLGGAMRQGTLPTRLGVHQLETGLFASVSLGLRMTAPINDRWLVRASADYRTSLGLQGTEMQRATAMSTPLRSHAVGFGVAPGFRFAAADSVSVLLHLGWHFRGLRPIAQLALPEVSWHAGVIRPELNIPLADGLVTLRLAPELLIIAGLYTTLPDESGLAHSGLGYGGEASLDVRFSAPVGLRIEYRESHASFRTAWAQNLSDIDRFAAIRVLLTY